jgi:hypothetical protein
VDTRTRVEKLAAMATSTSEHEADIARAKLEAMGAWPPPPPPPAPPVAPAPEPDPWMGVSSWTGVGRNTNATSNVAYTFIRFAEPGRP